MFHQDGKATVKSFSEFIKITKHNWNHLETNLSHKESNAFLTVDRRRCQSIHKRKRFFFHLRNQIFALCVNTWGSRKFLNFSKATSIVNEKNRRRDQGRRKKDKKENGLFVLLLRQSNSWGSGNSNKNIANSSTLLSVCQKPDAGRQQQKPSLIVQVVRNYVWQSHGTSQIDYKYCY